MNLQFQYAPTRGVCPVLFYENYIALCVFASISIMSRHLIFINEVKKKKLILYLYEI